MEEQFQQMTFNEDKRPELLLIESSMQSSRDDEESASNSKDKFVRMQTQGRNGGKSLQNAQLRSDIESQKLTDKIMCTTDNLTGGVFMISVGGSNIKYNFNGSNISSLPQSSHSQRTGFENHPTQKLVSRFLQFKESKKSFMQNMQSQIKSSVQNQSISQARINTESAEYIVNAKSHFLKSQSLDSDSENGNHRQLTTETAYLQHQDSKQGHLLMNQMESHSKSNETSNSQSSFRQPLMRSIRTG